MQHQPEHLLQPMSISGYYHTVWDDFLQNQIAQFAPVDVYLGVGNHTRPLPKRASSSSSNSPTGHIHDYLKSDNGKREVDLHPTVAAMLKNFIGERKSGLLFSTRTSRQLSQSNILRRSLHPILAKLGQPKTGCHAFRRFRVTWLRKNSVPEDLIRFWLGHAGKTVTVNYSKLTSDAEFRKQVAEKVGFGFELPSERESAAVGPNGPKTDVGAVEELAVSY